MEMMERLRKTASHAVASESGCLRHPLARKNRLDWR